jgi:hypothetical protein
LRRHIGSLSLDLAWVVDQPELQKEYEPACFLGVLKVDHIDLSEAPILPSQSEEDDIISASMVASQLIEL